MLHNIRHYIGGWGQPWVGRSVYYMYCLLRDTASLFYLIWLPASSLCIGFCNKPWILQSESSHWGFTVLKCSILLSIMADFLQLSPYKVLNINSYLDALTNVRCDHMRSCHGDITNVLYWPDIAPSWHWSLQCAVCSCRDATAPCGHSTHRAVAPAPTDDGLSHPW